MSLTVGSLFAGIGGFDLGFERAGFEIYWQVEIDPFCRAVLAEHWPNVKRYEDVRQCTTKQRAALEMDSMADSGCGDAPSCPITYHGLEPVDVIVGGFPCQDISSAGAKVGITGERSGLWSEFKRVVREVRPRYVVVENVAMLASRSGGLGVVLGDLAALGYDAEWESLPIALFGAPHLRARIFVVGYADVCRESDGSVDDETPWLSPVVANAEHAWRAQCGALGRAWGTGESVPWNDAGECTDSALAVRVDDGISDRMDRLNALGNSVSPQITEWIARRILEAEAMSLEGPR